MRRFVRVATVSILSILLLAVPSVALGHEAWSPDNRREHKILHATRIAKQQIGDPYVWGAAGPGAFDCSGLTSFAYHRAGLSMPRVSRDQYRATRHIKKRRIQRGDLMFFHDGGYIYHVGIFLKRKNGKKIILHSPRPGRTVQRDPVWTNQWLAGTLRRR